VVPLDGVIGAVSAARNVSILLLLSTYGRQAFAVAGPTVWISLPEDMHDPDVSEDSYRQSLKTFLFSQY